MSTQKPLVSLSQETKRDPQYYEPLESLREYTKILVGHVPSSLPWSVDFDWEREKMTRRWKNIMRGRPAEPVSSLDGVFIGMR